MRWVFIFLVFLNIFFYIWQRQQVTPLSVTDNDTPNYTEQNIPTIKLLKEQPITTPTPVTESTTVQQVEITNIKPDDNAEENSAVAPEPESLTCLYLGGFTNQEQLTVINPFLNEIARDINPIAVKLTHSPKFHLYITTENGQQQEILERLNTNSINSLVISRGPSKDNISLGLFPDETSYISLEEQLRTLDLPFKVENLPEAASSYWLRIPSIQQNLFTHAVLTELIQHLPTVQQELMPCKLTES